ncbi:MAG: hypothetical protein JNK05_17545 [Myxococcales bacterium]|nr:hypothetical protein [Myxococcales bacterium]
MSVGSKLFTAACVVNLIACVPPPAPTAARPAHARVEPPSREQRELREHQEAARHERKPDTGAHIALSVAPTQGDSTEVTVRITAQRAMPASKLRIGTELPARVDGEAEWDLAPMSAGATHVRTVRVHRGQTGGAVGTLVTASVALDSGAGTVTDMEVAWAFGPADPARVLPRSSVELGSEGVGSLGPNDRVVRTSEGDRVHESIVR